MTEPKTEPGFVLPRSKRPWWAAALIGGIGAGAAIAAALGLGSIGHGDAQAQVRTAGISTGQSDTEFRGEVMRELGDIRERLARIEGRLDRR